MLRNIWNAFCKEFDEQRLFLEAEVSNMREKIQTEKEKGGFSLAGSTPVYLLEELRTLFKELEEELEGHLTHLSNGKTSVLDRIQLVLNRDSNEQFQIVDRMEQDSLERMNKLRRKLERMGKDLHLSETEVTRLRESLAAVYDGGAPSAYKAIQGLSVDEENFSKESDLLHRLFEQNLDIRKNVT